MKLPLRAGVVLCIVCCLTSGSETVPEPKEVAEYAGEGRFISSLFFPIFPQFYDLDYGSVFEFLAQPDTIGYFVVRDVTSVSS